MISKKPEIKRVTLTGVQKRDLCFKKKAQPNLTQAELAKLFGAKENTVSTILKKSSYWLTLDESLTSAKRKRERIAAYPVIEEALYTWRIKFPKSYLVIFCEKSKGLCDSGKYRE